MIFWKQKAFDSVNNVLIRTLAIEWVGESKPFNYHHPFFGFQHFNDTNTLCKYTNNNNNLWVLKILWNSHFSYRVFSNKQSHLSLCATTKKFSNISIVTNRLAFFVGLAFLGKFSISCFIFIQVDTWLTRKLIRRFLPTKLGPNFR